MRYFISLAIVLASFSFSFSQCMLYEVSLEERFNNSVSVIEGKVLDQYAVKIDGYIYTIHEIEPTASFKGNSENEIIKIATPGGKLNDEILVVTPSLQLSVDESGVFFIKDQYITDHARKLYAGPQGFLRYDIEKNMAYAPFDEFYGIAENLYPLLIELGQNNYTRIKKINFNNSSPNNKTAGPITSISPDTLSAGTKSILTITGSGFGVSRGSGRVEFDNASSGPSSVSPAAAQYISWKDNEIMVEVPSEAGTGRVRVIKGGLSTSQDVLKIEFAQSNVVTNNGFAFPVAHINDNQKGGYDWRMNVSFDGNTNANNSFRRAIQNWIDATCVNWTIIEPTNVDKTTQDGTNIVRFGASGEVSTGVLAVTSSYYGTCSGGTIWYLSEVDMTYNDDIQWNFDQGSPKNFEYDIESVTVHELGHAHQLNHVIDEVDIMHRSIGPGDVNRDLSGINRKAGNFVQAQSVVKNACGPGAMTNFPGCTSILSVEEKLNDFDIEYFPNPVGNELTININQLNDIPVEFEIIDLSGKLIQNGILTAKMNKLDVSEIDAGLYLLSLKTPAGITKVSRLVIE